MAILLMALFTLSAFATDAEMYLASDKNGQNRVTMIQEGDEVWIAVYDPDEDIDCDVRDKIWTDVKVFDPKTGAYIVWVSYMDAAGDANGNDYNAPAYVPFKGHFPGGPVGWLGADYLEETGANTGLFASKRSYNIGTREDFNIPEQGIHALVQEDFQWGNYAYSWDPTTLTGVLGGIRGWFDCDGNFTEGLFGGEAPGPGPVPEPPDNGPPPPPTTAVAQPMQPEPPDPPQPPDPPDGEEPPIVPVVGPEWPCGRFENMDTIVGLYQDPNDASDTACMMAKIIDTEAQLFWSGAAECGPIAPGQPGAMPVYKDANSSALITVIDPDENINCNKAEWVPVFVIVNPGSWNPADDFVDGTSATNWCMLKRLGGVVPGAHPGREVSIRWYNIYDSGIGAFYPNNNQATSTGAYYIEYPTAGDGNVTFFETTDPDGFARVMFYAQETGVNTGVFELPINSILVDLGFERLDVCDTLVAYYLDPNDFDDFKLATAYIESTGCSSITSFTDANRRDQSLYWIGRDPVYVQVIDSNANVDACCPEQVVVHICDPHEEDDSEWLILDETSANSPVFFTNAGAQLLPVWDALGSGLPTTRGGFQLVLDNWKLEVFNEDSVYVRYNDVYYTEDRDGMLGLGDSNFATAFPPLISRPRFDNDVSFDLMEIADTQVFDGNTVNMWFLDRQGNRVTGFTNSDCVFVEVLDPDQDEDQHRRERVSGYWDGNAGIGQNYPFGPVDFPANRQGCEFVDEEFHPVNALFGDTNIFNNGTWAKLYILNPRNGRWAAVDLLETGVATGDFVSVTCIDLASQYECLPMLGVLPGDTLVAVYQDPSNHSDSAWVCIKVGCGGGGPVPGMASTTMFVDVTGAEVATYTDVDDVYVKVIDPSHAGAASLTGLEVEGLTFDLAPLAGAMSDTFITAAISMTDLGVGAGDSITATYTDPTDPTDSSSDTISIISSELDVTGFIAKPNPFDDEVVFAFAEDSSGIATQFTVSVYDLAGHLLASLSAENATEVKWDGTDEAGTDLANGAYIFVAVATDGEDTFPGKGKVFIKR